MYKLQAQGELAESIFQTKAIKEDFIVCKPFGQCQRYDFIIDYKGKVNRIQVKSVNHKKIERNIRKNKYGCHAAYNKTRTSKSKYSKRDVDFLACYIIPEDIWYLIPINKIKGFQVSLNPKSKKGYYEIYKENWDVLKT